eukprot:PLAT6230.1.p1 GENE.PLAT6230.1~~PLAT6230.1.p1  ORF type:complete len:546 (+),score=156.59 PLAT6230.1:84-1721(+)
MDNDEFERLHDFRPLADSEVAVLGRRVAAEFGEWVDVAGPEEDPAEEAVEEEVAELPAAAAAAAPHTVWDEEDGAADSAAGGVKGDSKEDADSDDDGAPVRGPAPLALHRAAARGDYSAVRFLVETCGCDIDELDDLGRTPLYLAQERGHTRVIQYFRASGVRWLPLVGHSKMRWNSAGRSLLELTERREYRRQREKLAETERVQRAEVRRENIRRRDLSVLDRLAYLKSLAVARGEKPDIDALLGQAMREERKCHSRGAPRRRYHMRSRATPDPVSRIKAVESGKYHSSTGLTVGDYLSYYDDDGKDGSDPEDYWPMDGDDGDDSDGSDDWPALVSPDGPEADEDADDKAMDIESESDADGDSAAAAVAPPPPPMRPSLVRQSSAELLAAEGPRAVLQLARQKSAELLKRFDLRHEGTFPSLTSAAGRSGGRRGSRSGAIVPPSAAATVAAVVEDAPPPLKSSWSAIAGGGLHGAPAAAAFRRSSRAARVPSKPLRRARLVRQKSRDEMRLAEYDMRKDDARGKASRRRHFSSRKAGKGGKHRR